MSVKQLALHDSQLYDWRKKAEHRKTVSERESTLATENARLKRELAQAREEIDIAKKAATYFAKQYRFIADHVLLKLLKGIKE